MASLTQQGEREEKKKNHYYTHTIGEYALQQPVHGHILHRYIRVAASCETRVHARAHSLLAA